MTRFFYSLSSFYTFTLRGRSAPIDLFSVLFYEDLTKIKEKLYVRNCLKLVLLYKQMELQ